MTPTLLHAVARKAEAFAPDADLLARFAGDRDHPAFEELVRRHGPLVWAVCRQMLAHHADAEDAFQAVFLALVRSAASIRDGRTLPAWLHGVAVRVATRARRQFARRRDRDRAAALPEADRPVSNAEWESLVAAVHEEVQRLPEAERTAFVLCDLEGVSQPDAAARLGCPLGSVSGRLCKARQRLLERLTARGIAPAAGVGIGLTAGVASAVPTKLFDAVKTFPGSPGAASSAASVLARGLTEGVAMRVKLLAATTVVVAAFGLTGGAVLLSQADAQQPEVVNEVKNLVGGLGEGQPPGGGPGGFPGGGPGAPGGLPGGAAGFPGAPPGAGGAGAPGAPPGMGGGGGGWAVSPVTWEYKFVDLQTNQGDTKEFKKTITQHGKEGWEFCGSERFSPADLTLVFKKRKGGDFPFGGAGGGGMPGIGGGWRDWVPNIGGRAGAGIGDLDVLTIKLKNANANDVAAALNKALPKGVTVIAEPNTNVIVVSGSPAAIKEATRIVEEAEARPGKGPGPAGPGGPVGGPAKPGAALNVFHLKVAKAEELVLVLKPLFPNADMSADPRTNSVIARADEKSLDEMKALIARLETASAVKPK